jgi:predicted nuclease of predicted toxin-antitoxin system
MKLRDFPLLTDENLDAEVVASLRKLGFDVRDVVESGLRGSSDVDLLRLAAEQKRVVVTHDADFGTLAIRQNEPLIGLVYLRPGHIDSQFTIETIQTVLSADPDLLPPFVLVAKRISNKVTIRIRQLGTGNGHAAK